MDRQSPFLFVTACVSRPLPPADIVVALAPTGRLRASINLGNPILARRDPVTGEAVSVPVDLARELAEHRGVGIVPYVLIEGAYWFVRARHCATTPRSIAPAPVSWSAKAAPTTSS